MSRALVVYERDMPTVRGLIDPLTHLAANDEGLSVASSLVTELTPEMIDACDVLILVRPCDVLSAAAARRAHLAGRTVVSFFDDDLLAHKPEAPWRLSAMRRTLADSDVILSSSRRICEKYKDLTYGKRTSVIDMMVSPDQIHPRVKKPDNAPVKFVYAANPGHVRYFDEFIRPVFGEFAERFGKKVSFTFVGVRPELPEFEDLMDLRFVKGMPLQEYRDFMASEHFDVGIAPMEDTEFTRCKYFNKYIEYSMVGVMGIYSDIIPYTYVVRDHENGLLAANTREGWLNTLTEAASDPDLADRMVESAQKDLRTRFTEENSFARMCSDIPEILSPAGTQKSCGSISSAKVKYRLLRVLDWSYLSVYYIKNGGFAQKLKIHFRERGAYSKGDRK